MQVALCIVLGLLTAGCVADNSLGTMSESEKNVSNLSRINVGMTESQVLCIMRRPYSQETIVLASDTYDVWFYVTMPTALGQTEMVRMNLTPLTFKNGALVGTDYLYYKWVLNQQKMNAQAQTKENQPQPADTDTDLEKTLDKTLAPSQKKTLSMSSKPKNTSDAEDDAPPLKEEDGKMIRMEGDQNFDFW